MNRVEKIKAEIKRRYNILKNVASPENKDYYDGKIEAYIETLDFLNSLKEPVSNDLEEAAVEAFKQIVDSDKNNFLEIFKAGAEWQKERILNNAIEREVKVDAGGYPYIDVTELYDYDKDRPIAKKGDKVKLIIIIEE